jgi:hypothetical protein
MSRLLSAHFNPSPPNSTLKEKVYRRLRRALEVQGVLLARLTQSSISFFETELLRWLSSYLTLG